MLTFLKILCFTYYIMFYSHFRQNTTFKILLFPLYQRAMHYGSSGILLQIGLQKERGLCKPQVDILGVFSPILDAFPVVGLKSSRFGLSDIGKYEPG